MLPASSPVPARDSGARGAREPRGMPRKKLTAAPQAALAGSEPQRPQGLRLSGTDPHRIYCVLAVCPALSESTCLP